MKYPTLRDFRGPSPYDLGQDVDPDEMLIEGAAGIGSATPSCHCDITIPKTRLIIGYNADGPHLLEITTPQPMPNVWIRFWHRFLLGWRWEAIDKKDSKPEMDEAK